MRAIRQYEFGPAKVLRYEEVPDPVPGGGQVRVAVAASGVHLLDTSIRAGTSGGPFPLPELPTTPGREVAGVVDRVGPGVDDTWVGRRVVAHLGQASGGYAELAIAPAVALQALPDNVSEDAAVAMIGTGRTTMGILETAELGADDVVLVTAAAGGIGNLIIQEAGHVGAVSVGVAGGAAKVKQVQALGATVAVDYTQPDWAQRVRDALDGREVTVALDGVGGAIGRQALELVGKGGRLLLFGWASGEITPLTAMDLYKYGITVGVALGPMLLDRKRDLETKALAAAASGRWNPLIGEIFPLARAEDAHAALESRNTMGKVILKP
jgi:NADPH:quinone reductase